MQQIVDNNLIDTSFTLPIVGMTCAACVSHVGEALERIPEVERAVVNLATEKATVHISSGHIQKELLKSAVQDAGYQLGSESITLSIEGMTCAACVSHVESSLLKLEGVEEAYVNLATETAKVQYIPGFESVSSIRLAITNSGYSSSYIEKEELGYGSTDRSQKRIVQQAAVSLLGAGFIMLGMVPGLASPLPFQNEYLSFVIATIVQFWAGRQFFTSAWNAARHRTTNMNTLIAVGTSTAYLYSTFAILGKFFGINDAFPETYFSTSCAIIGMVLLGRYLESKSRRRATDSIKSLLDMAPKTANIIKGTDIKIVPVDDLVIGDLVIIKPGEKIPVDGSVMEGFSEIDESTLTGESIPRAKKIGDPVFTSTINGTGNIKVITESLSDNTVYSKIVSLIEDTQASKAPIQRIADRLASLLVPAILVVAALTFLTWIIVGPDPTYSYATIAAVAVLVIACPCAMGLATPIAIMVGSGRGAENGILYRDALAIETLQKVDSVVFDKTGTLTKGQPKVTRINSHSSHSAKEILEYAGAVEKNSEHIIAKAIVTECESREIVPVDVSEFRSFPGLGTSGVLNEKAVLVGNKIFLTGAGIEVPDTLNSADLGEVHVSIDGSYSGSIFFSDTIRDDAAETIAHLHDLNLNLVLLSGDREESVESVANVVNISRYESNFLPQDKATYISDMQKKGQVVCMVGDGVNDAPALAQADIGIAMGGGTDIAIESAQITVLGNRLSSIVQSIQLSKSCITTIKQNLFWAFAYNLLLVPIAAGILYPLFASQTVPGWLSPLLGDRGFLNPIVAATAMGLSSITVVLNALRLKTSKLIR